MALIAEELGEWDEARKIYEHIIADPDAEFAGTIFPKQAQRRLDIMDEISRPMEFSPPPPPVEEPSPTEFSLTPAESEKEETQE